MQTGATFRAGGGCRRSALARLETGVALVDYVDAALAAHDAAIHMSGFRQFQRISNLHGRGPLLSTARIVVLRNHAARNIGSASGIVNDGRIPHSDKLLIEIRNS